MKKKAKKPGKISKPAKVKKPLTKAHKPLKEKVIKAAKAILKVPATKAKKQGEKTRGQRPEKGAKNQSPNQNQAQAAAQSLRPEKEVILTNAEGKQYCKVHDCDNAATTDGHCRLHYLALWKRNRTKSKILEGGKLDKYIEDLTNKYPDKYLEMLRKDLSSEKDFNLIVAEMDVEDAGEDVESEEDASRFIEEVRGGVPSTDDDDTGF